MCGDGPSNYVRRSRHPHPETLGHLDPGAAVWAALTAQGWIVPRKDGQEADVRRGDKYGMGHFDGALAPLKVAP